MKDYYPGLYNPLHQVLNWTKVRSMIRALRRGDSLPPVYTDGGNWLSGTHRVAASEIRAELDGLCPYEDLTILDMSDWLNSLTETELQEVLQMENEDLADLFDACDTFDEFRAAVHNKFRWLEGEGEDNE